MPFLDRGDVRLRYEDDGEGPALLLSHGYGASAEMWQGQVDAFKDRYRIIRWDMRGHGKTECPDDLSLFSQTHTVEDMAALLDHLAVERAVIGGHSLGGYMSMAFNVDHAERVSALYLQACGPGFRNDESRAKWNAYAESRGQALDENGLEALQGQIETKFSIQRSARDLANAARGILPQFDARAIDSLPGIKVPVLIVVGGDDTRFLAGCEYMESRIPGAKRIVVPGAGHGVNIQEPEAVNEALAAFLKRV